MDFRNWLLPTDQDHDTWNLHLAQGHRNGQAQAPKHALKGRRRLTHSGYAPRHRPAGGSLHVPGHMETSRTDPPHLESAAQESPRAHVDFEPLRLHLEWAATESDSLRDHTERRRIKPFQLDLRRTRQHKRAADQRPLHRGRKQHPRKRRGENRHGTEKPERGPETPQLPYGGHGADH